MNVPGVERKLAALVLLAFGGRAPLRELKLPRPSSRYPTTKAKREEEKREGQVEGIASSLFNLCFFLQCFDAVGWAAGRASDL